MKAYRYLETQFGPDFLQGRFRIGTTEYYKEFENQGQDPFEATTERTLPYLHMEYSQEFPVERKQIAENYGIFISGASQGITLRNNTRRSSLPSVYALCLSDTPDNQTLLNRGLEFVIEIDDLETFASRVAGCYPQRFGLSFCGAIQYGVRRTTDQSLKLSPDYFVKEPRWESEREVRIIWLPSESDQSSKLSPFIAEVENVKNQLRRVR